MNHLQVSLEFASSLNSCLGARKWSLPSRNGGNFGVELSSEKVLNQQDALMLIP